MAVIGDELRRRDWADESPLGRRGIQWHGRPVTLEIVGVVGQLRHEGLASRPRAEVFVRLNQLPFTSMTDVVRGAVIHAR